jgi:uncharacterized protein YggT (Ycf19 family)
MQLPFHLINGARLLIIVDAVASFVVHEGQFPRSVTSPLLNPIYRPIQDAGALVGNLDLSPLIALLLLQLAWMGLQKMGHRDPQ